MKQNLCARCGKRPAVVFIQRVEGDEVKPEGLCINCARDLNIGPIRQMIEKLGISDEDLEAASEQMNMFMENMDDFNFDDLGELFNPDNADGAQTMPFQNLFGSEGSVAGGENSDGKETATANGIIDESTRREAKQAALTRTEKLADMVCDKTFICSVSFASQKGGDVNE